MKKQNRKSDKNRINYRELMRYTSGLNIEKTKEWLANNRQKPGFNIDQIIWYQGSYRKPIELFLKLYPTFYAHSVQKSFFKLLRVYLSKETEDEKKFCIEWQEWEFTRTVKDIPTWLPKIKIGSELMRLRNKKQQTFLHGIIQKPPALGLAKYIPLLIEKNADIEASDHLHYTPILLAAEQNHVMALKLLVDHKANLYHISELGNILDVALCNKAKDAYRFVKYLLTQHQRELRLGSALTYFVKANDLAEMKFFLEENGDVDWQEPETGRTALMEAAHLNYKPQVQWLLEAKADPNQTDVIGITAIHVAIICSDVSLLACFLEPKYQADFSYLMPKFHATYLLIAAQLNKTVMVAMFLSKNINANIEDTDRCTPLLAAIKIDAPELIAILIEKTILNHKKYITEAIIHCSCSVLKIILQHMQLEKSDFIALSSELLNQAVDLNKFEHFKCLIAYGFSINQNNLDEINPIYNIIYQRRYLWLVWLHKFGLLKNPHNMRLAILLAAALGDKKITVFLMDKFFAVSQHESYFWLEVTKKLMMYQWKDLIKKINPSMRKIKPQRGLVLSTENYPVVSTSFTFKRAMSQVAFFKLINLDINQFLPPVVVQSKIRPAIVFKPIKNFSCWLEGLIDSNDKRLMPVEGTTRSNTYIFVDKTWFAQENHRPFLKTRWHFDLENGLVGIVSKPRCQANICVGAKTIPLETSFSVEIKIVGATHRILCIEVPACQGRGCLIIPCYYLKGGLHRKNLNLPKEIVVNLASENTVIIRRLGGC